jgi:hypothetical protein
MGVLCLVTWRSEIALRDISRPLRRLSQYTAPILLCFSRHWAPSQYVHIGLADDGILKYRNM